jgi:hypothetical protein
MFLRAAEAAARACPSTKAIDRGELGAVRLCSRLRIPREAFDTWIASSTVRCAWPDEVVPPPVRDRDSGG